MRALGYLLLLGSAIALVNGLALDTSVATLGGGRVHNLGLLALQQNLMLLGVGGFLGGLITLLVRRPSAAPTPNVVASKAPVEDETAPRCGDYVCPDCGGKVHFLADHCKACGTKFFGVDRKPVKV